MENLLLFLLLCCIASSLLLAQTIPWASAVDENYSNPKNRNPAQVFMAANYVIIPNGSRMTIHNPV